MDVETENKRLADAPDVLTVPEAAALLRIGRDAAYNLVRNGDLHAVRVGRTLRVPKHAVLELLGVPAGSGHRDDAA